MTRKKNKVLIIKIGYTEVLDKDQDSEVISLGDVLRTTCILHLFKEDHVTWVTSSQAAPLLMDNPYIDRLLKFNFIVSERLKSEEFDVIINLEKVPGICALSDKIRARRARYGFTFNTQTGDSEALDKAHEVLAVSFNPDLKKENQRTVEDHLFGMVGEKFNKEEIILGYKPKNIEIYDIGFNIEVGSKWPSKKWPVEYWDKLEIALRKKYSISRQDKQDKSIFKNLYSYIDWINSCKTIITNDSLGLHIGTALKKNVICLFGPTSSSEIYLYNRGLAIIPDSANGGVEYNGLKCMPCFEPICSISDKSCMYLISPEKVEKKVDEIMQRKSIKVFSKPIENISEVSY